MSITATAKRKAGARKAVGKKSTGGTTPAANGKPSNGGASKAVHYGTLDILAPPGKVQLISAQDKEGLFYADWSLEWKTPDKVLRNRRAAETPSKAKKFGTLQLARFHAKSQAFTQLELTQLSGNHTGAQFEAMEDMMDALHDVTDAELAAGAPLAEGEKRLVDMSAEEMDAKFGKGGKGDEGKENRVGDSGHNGQLQKVPLVMLADHPGNPDPSEAEVVAMMAWLDEPGGQQEAITVRRLGDGYQVLAGKTRLAAARRLGWETLDARVRMDLDGDTAADEFAAKNNDQRRTENPLRKAAWCRYLVDQGRTVAEAGQVYGWSAGYTSSMMGLLGLPEPWLGRIVSGEMPATVAVRLVPYAEHAGLLKAFDKQYRQGEFIAEHWRLKDGIGTEIERVVDNLTRPMEPKDTHDYGWKLGHDHGCYFKKTAEVEAKLDVVELPIGKNGKRVRRALNVKAYDKLNLPLVKEAAGGKKKATPAAKLTPAEERKEASRKRKEANLRVAERSKEMGVCFLRLGISEALVGEEGHAMALLPVVQAMRPTSEEGMQAVVSYAAWSVDPLPDAWAKGGQTALLDRVLVALELDEDRLRGAEDMQIRILQLLFWPQPAAGSLLVPEDHAVLSAGCPWGNRLPEISRAAIERVAGLLGVTVAAEWKKAAIHGPRQLQLVEAFVQLHTRDQLDTLAKELGCEAWMIEAKTKTATVASVVAAHTKNHVLPLPKVLIPAKKKKRGKK